MKKQIYFLINRNHQYNYTGIYNIYISNEQKNGNTNIHRVIYEEYFILF